MLYKKYNKTFVSIIIVVLFLILGLWTSNFYENKKIIKESYITGFEVDDSFYLSDIRTRDYQDVISITESQLIETS
jgi:hypothetical protein